MILTLGKIAEICDGAVEEQWAKVQIEGVSTDTRTLKPGELFVALQGEWQDGHDFVPQAFEAGAAGVLVARPLPAVSSRPLVVVDDTLVAYGKLAAHHRAGLDVTIAAVTGSSGKTTTKNLVGAVLRQVGPTLIAPGTENNEIGVPRALLRLNEKHQFCALEMAMRGPGEIAYLAQLARPQIGVITNVGDAHIGRLGSREKAAQAKAELLTELPDDGVAVLNADDFFFGLLSEMTSCPIISFGLDNEADVTATELRPRGLQGTDFTLRAPCGQITVSLKLPGRHNVHNALAGAVAGVAVGASAAQSFCGRLVALWSSMMPTMPIRIPWQPHCKCWLLPRGVRSQC